MRGEEVRGVTGAITFDLRDAAPEVFAALERDAPHVSAALDALRGGDVPLMPNATPGEHGHLYRMKGHNRSVCLALADDKTSSDVIVFKGSEPLLPDFEHYLRWMTGTQFGAWPRPLAEHFPLFEGKAPGTLLLGEAMAEAMTALDVQKRHLTHYGTLMRLPVPLFVWKLAPDDAGRTIVQLERHLSAMAFERLGAHLREGIGVFAYYYPGPPVRAHAVGRAAHMWPAPAALATPAHLLDRAVPGWVTIGARLLWLGLLPTTPLSWRLGDIFDPNNVCLDGGVCDVGSIHPITSETSDGFFVRSIVMSMGGLRMAIARAFNVSLGELPASYEQDMTSFYLTDFVKRAMERALEAEARPGLQLDPRLQLTFGAGKSLPEIMEIVKVYGSYFTASEYAAPE
jgi:hypothetical protein